MILPPKKLDAKKSTFAQMSEGKCYKILGKVNLKNAVLRNVHHTKGGVMHVFQVINTNYKNKHTVGSTK